MGVNENTVESLARQLGMELQASRWGVSRPALFSHGLELAHMENDGIDIRMGRRSIRTYRGALISLDARIRRDWVWISFSKLSLETLECLLSTAMEDQAKRR